jgi:hypothetical protein
MIVPDNRVQYVLDLESVAEKNFDYDERRRVLTFHAPDPILDREMVNVQSDPRQIKIVEAGTGLYNLERLVREPVKNEHLQKIKGHVIREGEKPLYLAAARQSAELQVRKLLAPLQREMGGEIEVDVRFPSGGDDADGKTK